MPGSPPEAVAQIRAEAARLAESLLRGGDPEAWERERAELRRLTHALAHAPAAEDLPWATWIEADARQYPDWAAFSMAAATAALGPRAVALARAMDQRETPDGLRLEVHVALWLLDPGEAGARARALLFRDDPRAQDRLRPAYFETVLPFVPEPDATDLLLRAAAYDGMEHRARLLAIRALVERRSAEAPPILESVFLAERSNFVLRREAFQGLLELDRARGRRLLEQRHPDEQADPGFGAWLNELREQEGVRVG